ncbi:MAG: GNAT family N-acetyltransferase [Clostridiales bacterium]|nr:GNAT family N-acetyltransferase [Candidatus Blautia equi]
MLEFRKATEQDIDGVAVIYDAVHTEEENGRTTTGWRREIYPLRETAVQGVKDGDLFVLEVDGKVAATAKINQEQVPIYADGEWEYPAEPSEVMVLHTLAVLPSEMGKSYGPAFVDYYEKYALQHGCPYLRMDTNERNVKARKLYKKLGYKEIGILPCKFNGIPGVNLVLLEKKL